MVIEYGEHRNKQLCKSGIGRDKRKRGAQELGFGSEGFVGKKGKGEEVKMDVPIASRIVAAFRWWRKNQAEIKKRNPKLRQSQTLCSTEDGMRQVYRHMGLSEDEIAERLVCKATKVIERKGNLDECDK